MVDSQIGEDFVYSTKRCPECYTYVSLHTTKCPSCNIRLGEVEKHGMAKKTVDWKAYAMAFIAVLGFIIYIWWAFL
jgi:hypothetical protein